MGAIRIITDSACDIPVDIAERLSITVVPLSIRFGNDEYVDREGLSPSEFWAKCNESSDLPETAAPSPGAFQASFEAAREAGADGVVCITLSSELSATFQAARAAAEAMAPYPVNVVDSRAVTMAQGLLVIDAAEFAATGASFDEVVAHTGHNVPLTGVVGALDTLEHLKKGGRVGGAQALLGSMLSIKPLLELADGKVAEAGRARTRAKALAQISKLVHEQAPYARLAVAHGSASDLDTLLGLLGDVETDVPIVVTEIGSVVGTHGGPGIIGICWLDRG
jgi:DegV family protein with EDD domain